MGGPVLAKAQKMDLVPAVANAPGGGFVVFNNSAGTSQSFEMELALKKVAPNTAYDIYLFVDGTVSGDKIGTVTTNGLTDFAGSLIC